MERIKPPDPLRFHGASPPPPRPSLSGCWRSSVTPTASTASPPGHPRHRVGRDPAGQGRRGDREADLPLHQGGGDLALRFDLTVPWPSMWPSHYGELAFPFRRYQIGKGLPGEQAQRGRFREFYQCDIDVIGGRQAGHRQRGGNPRHHLPGLHCPGAGALPHPGEQPEDPHRLLRHGGPGGPGRGHHAHRGQAG